MRVEERARRAGLNAHQIAAARRMIKRYRQSFLEVLHRKRIRRNTRGQQIVTVLSPPLGSAVARRRVRLAMRDFAAGGAVIEDDRIVKWGRRAPHVLSVAVTYACQCHCEHCSADKYRQRVAREGGLLSDEELIAAIGHGVDAGATCVILGGGEPLLRPRLFEIVASIDRCKATPVLFTNGEYLTAETVSRLVASGLHGVFVSLDSSRAETHDAWRHRPGLFDKATAGIRRCVSAGLATGISTVATQERVRGGDLPRLMNLARDLDVMEVIVFDITPAGRLEDMPRLLLTSEDKAEIQRLVAEHNDRPGHPNLLHESVFAYFAVPSVQGCPAGFVLLHLRGNGDVTACDGMPIPFGNVRTEPMGRLWERISSHAAFCECHAGCRLADPEFVSRYLKGRMRFE
jgi:MoaA/NifB/PqqE/SkfB family radical SAM enzyme